MVITREQSILFQCLGHIQVYTGSDPIALVETGLILQPDLGWHTFELVVDLVARRYMSVTIDGATADLSAIPLAQVAQPDWGTDVSLTITTESLATWPQADCRDAFARTVWFRFLAFGSLDG